MDIAELDLLIDHPDERQPSVSVIVEAREELDRVLRAITRLPAEEKLLLRDAFLERPQEAMAQDRQASVRAVEGRLHRLRQRLREDVA